jgi:acetylglutamate kinase
MTTVVKFGGELLEDRARLDVVVSTIAGAAASGTPLVIVHGGGKEIDAALKAAGIEKRQVDGLRITDAATLEVVVAVLAGTINTRLVAALVAAGVPAVGLTGADAGCGLCEPAPPHRAVDGRIVDLGRVGIPSPHADVRVIAVLAAAGFVPVLACVGVDAHGQLLNVNADTLAAHAAARLRAARLIMAGTTPGVLDDHGETLTQLARGDIDRLIAAGTATAGMIAKLRAAADTLDAGVPDVVVVDGRDRLALDAALRGHVPPGATCMARAVAGQLP